MTKTNFSLIKDLEEVYKPQERGIATSYEVSLVKNILELNTASEIELRNMRDFVVLFYGHKADSGERFDMGAWDKMSAITSIIDSVISSRGGEV